MKFCTLTSGSSGNCTLISDGSTTILIDCGINGKQAHSALTAAGVCPTEVDAILVTHEHSDHTGGIGVMSRRYGIPIYANTGTWTAMEYQLGKLDRDNIRTFSNDTDFEIGSLGIKAFGIPHDARSPVGYNIFIGGTKLSVATDMGYVSEDVMNNLLGSKMVVLESNHDVDMLRNGSYPFYLKQRILSELGHLPNENAAQIALRLVQGGTSHIILAHLSRENNRPDKAYHASLCALENAGVSIGDDVMICVAEQWAAAGAW